MKRKPFDLVVDDPLEPEFRPMGFSPRFEGQEHPTEKGWFWTGTRDHLGFPLYVPRPNPAQQRRERLQAACRRAALWMVMSPLALMLGLFAYTVVESLTRGFPRP